MVGDVTSVPSTIPFLIPFFLFSCTNSLPFHPLSLFPLLFFPYFSYFLAIDSSFSLHFSSLLLFLPPFHSSPMVVASFFCIQIPHLTFWVQIPSFPLCSISLLYSPSPMAASPIFFGTNSPFSLSFSLFLSFFAGTHWVLTGKAVRGRGRMQGTEKSW